MNNNYLRILASFGNGAQRIMVLCLALICFSLGAFAAQAQTVEYNLQSTSVLKINLPVSQAVTVIMSGPVGKVVSADASIADAQPITDQSLYLIGKGFGTTTVNLFSEEGSPIGLISVEVGVDAVDVAGSIRAAIPDSRVKVRNTNGRIQLSGTVASAGDMEKMLSVVEQYGSPAVINTVTFEGGRQVNLEVRILEVQRDAGRQIGIRWGGSVGGVDVTVNNTTEDAASFASFVTSVLSGVSGVDLEATISALEAKNLVRTLAEPNLTTLSGVEASFLAGGQVPIRTNDQNGISTLEYRDFGVRLLFTPVVLGDGRVQIHLQPEVSAIGGFTSSGDPVFNTRTLDATVELRDGQSFSVAGLLQNDTVMSQSQLPWLGEIPVLGSLFKSSSYQKNETELVVLVTPRLVQPATPAQPLASPLDQTLPANDIQFFGLGQMEVTPDMIRRFELGEDIVGPYGFIIELGEVVEEDDD